MKNLTIQEEDKGAIITKALEHKRKSGLIFSQVFISKIVKNKAYVAEFNVSFNNAIIQPMETRINGNSVEECIKKSEAFLGTKIKPS